MGEQPGEADCPHCGRHHALDPQRMAAYGGIACVRCACGRLFPWPESGVTQEQVDELAVGGTRKPVPKDPAKMADDFQVIREALCEIAYAAPRRLMDADEALVAALDRIQAELARLRHLADLARIDLRQQGEMIDRLVADRTALAERAREACAQAALRLAHDHADTPHGIPPGWAYYAGAMESAAAARALDLAKLVDPHG